jgi:hypothetical protein
MTTKKKYQLRIGKQWFADLEPHDDGYKANNDIPDVLLGHAVIAEVDFHIEAHRVITNEENHLQEDQYRSNESFLDKLGDISGADGPFETVKINGHDYVVAIYPFCN